jgi:hypothetical protein
MPHHLLVLHQLDDCGLTQFFQLGQVIDSRVAGLFFIVQLDTEGFVLDLRR